MNAIPRSGVFRLVSLVSLVAAVAACVGAARGQQPGFYSVNKVQGLLQTSAAAPGADPTRPFQFSAQSASAVTFTNPSGTPITLPANPGGDSAFQLEQNFGTKAAMDAAFPAGTYRMTGTGISALSLNLGTELYPTSTPQITNGTWNNGLLVVNPAQSTTLNLSTFTEYATAGQGGHMEVRLQDLNGGDVNLPGTTQVVSKAVAGLPATTTPITSMTIPAGVLTTGRVYEGEITFDTLSTLDTTSVPNGGLGIAIFEKTLRFYVAAQATGTNPPAIAITNQPANVSGVLGGQATISLGYTVGGAPPNQNNFATIIWTFNGLQIDFSGNQTKYQFNGSSLVVRNLTNADVGAYAATLIGPGGIVTSNTANLTLTVATGATISRQPTSATVTQGSTATFRVEASGSPPLTYQWQRNGVNFTGTGANGPTMSIPGAQSASAGTYTCIVSNGIGNPVTSDPATLSIATNFNDAGRLTNLSVLTDISAAVPSFTLGTVVGGANTTGTKPLVIRAVGPSLGALGVPGTIADPKVDLLTGQTVAATNDNWNGDAGVLNAMASVGAFAFTGATSKDAAIYSPSLSSRDYTVQVSGVGGATGSVIAEIYDATPAGTFNAQTPRLINVSVLKTINTNGTITLGFTIGGSSAKAILIRAIGPGLAAVTGTTAGTVADPQLTLFNAASVAIATNNDWNSDQAISVVGNRVSAFSVGQSTKDAMMLVTLPAGGYTAQASGVGGVGGNVIVEAYEVP